MGNDLTTGFDYESVDAETAGKLRYFAERGRKILKETQLQLIARMGELLSEAHTELANHKNGTFIKWATTEFDISPRTVDNYRNAWENILRNGCGIYSNLSATALYLLASDDTPKPVHKKIEKLAAQGEPIRKADIQRLIDASRAKTKPEPKPILDVPSESEQPADPVVIERETGSTPEPTPEPDSEHGKCPNCASTRWKEDEWGLQCAKCGQVHGEPAGDVDEKRVKEQRAKTIKTAEALLRAFDDLHLLSPNPAAHSEAIDGIKWLLGQAKGWT